MLESWLQRSAELLAEVGETVNCVNMSVSVRCYVLFEE